MTAIAVMSATIGSTVAHFEITAKIGEGGMGEVYRATDAKLGREVAFKVLPEAMASDPERLSRFRGRSGREPPPDGHRETGDSALKCGGRGPIWPSTGTAREQLAIQRGPGDLSDMPSTWQGDYRRRGPCSPTWRRTPCRA